MLVSVCVAKLAQKQVIILVTDVCKMVFLYEITICAYLVEGYELKMDEIYP